MHGTINRRMADVNAEQIRYSTWGTVKKKPTNSIKQFK